MTIQTNKVKHLYVECRLDKLSLIPMEARVHYLLSL